MKNKHLKIKPYLSKTIAVGNIVLYFYDLIEGKNKLFSSNLKSHFKVTRWIQTYVEQKNCTVAPPEILHSPSPHELTPAAAFSHQLEPQLHRSSLCCSGSSKVLKFHDFKPKLYCLGIRGRTNCISSFTKRFYKITKRNGTKSFPHCPQSCQAQPEPSVNSQRHYWLQQKVVMN